MRIRPGPPEPTGADIPQIGVGQIGVSGRTVGDKRGRRAVVRTGPRS
jgi:hypothetical protein